MEALLAHSQWLLLLGSSWQAQILPLQVTAKQLDARVYMIRGMHFVNYLSQLSMTNAKRNLVPFHIVIKSFKDVRVRICEGRNRLSEALAASHLCGWLNHFTEEHHFSMFPCVNVHVEAYYKCRNGSSSKSQEASTVLKGRNGKKPEH